MHICTLQCFQWRKPRHFPAPQSNYSQVQEVNFNFFQRSRVKGTHRDGGGGLCRGHKRCHVCIFSSWFCHTWNRSIEKLSFILSEEQWSPASRWPSGEPKWRPSLIWCWSVWPCPILSSDPWNDGKKRQLGRREGRSHAHRHGGRVLRRQETTVCYLLLGSAPQNCGEADLRSRSETSGGSFHSAPHHPSGSQGDCWCHLNCLGNSGENKRAV